MTPNLQADNSFLVKELFLAQPEWERIRRTLHFEDLVQKILSNVLLELVAETQQKIDEEWDRLAKNFGYESLYDLSFRGMTMKIDWSTRAVQLRSKTEPGKEEPGKPG